MEAAGMDVRRDAIGNLIGRLGDGDRRTLLIGSHLDTVRDAGRYDGVLGVLVAIGCLEQLRDHGRSLPYAVEVFAFADEEGVRYGTGYLGSSVVAGCFDSADLERRDAAGVTLADAVRAFGGAPEGLAGARREPADLIGYYEVHIEQGPVLEGDGVPLGVVTAIAGQTAGRIVFTGEAGHAGTVPMALRRDALGAAAEFVTALEVVAREREGVVATIGSVEIEPGARNVIPGRVVLSLDVRHASDPVRKSVLARLRERARPRRGVRVAGRERHASRRHLGCACREGCRGGRGVRPSCRPPAERRGPRRRHALKDRSRRDAVCPLRRRRQPQPGRVRDGR
jgi:allantoate deiminase